MKAHRSTMRSKSGCAALLAAAALTVAPAARAQEAAPSSADVSAARSLGQEGVKLADDGRCREAIERLTRAEKLFHAPTTLERLGECQVRLLKLVEGTENLNRVVREQLGPSAPAVFRDAQERARSVLAEARPRLAKLMITVHGADAAPKSVTLDGEPVPDASLDVNRPADPGAHVIEASAPGFKVSRATVTLTEGGADAVTLTLERDPNAPVRRAPFPGSGTPASDEPRSSRRGPAIVALVGGTVVLGAGVVFGLLALGKKSDLDAACTDKVCPTAASQDTIDSGKTFAAASTVGIAVGAASLVAGVVLLLTDRPAPRAAWSTPGPGASPGVRGAGLTFTVRGLGLGGSF